MPIKTKPIPAISEQCEALFWKKLKKRQDGVWEWLASKNKYGYGVFSINRKTFLAHRVSWVIKERSEGRSGLIPNNLQVLHKNDVDKNGVCDVNPDNLWIGTPFDNHQDCSIKGRCSFFKTAGDKNFHARLTPEKVAEIRRLSKTMTKTQLAKKFSVTWVSIKNILTGKTWKTAA